MQQVQTAFLGAGGIAEAHSFAIDALPHFYKQSIKVSKAVVASRTRASAASFAEEHGFKNAVAIDDFWDRDDFETVYILGPNSVHFEHLVRVLEMKHVRRVYVEKPVCASKNETDELESKCAKMDKLVWGGFQYLQIAAIREARKRLAKIDLGQPIHFSASYLHRGYLDKSYREKRLSRLTPSPAGGAMVDLGSHVLSLIDSFLGPELELIGAYKSGGFPDVLPISDLCSFAILREARSAAVGSILASRVSAGARESIELEIRFERGAFRYSSGQPDVLFWNQSDMNWTEVYCGSDYSPASTFPSARVSAGWFRALIHSNHLFLGGHDDTTFRPDIAHGLRVQNLLNDFAEHVNSK